MGRTNDILRTENECLKLISITVIIFVKTLGYPIFSPQILSFPSYYKVSVPNIL